MLGCKRDGKLRYTDVDGEALWRCPLAVVSETPWVYEILGMARRIEEYGILPNAGGWYDQSAVFIEALEVIEEARAMGVYDA